MIWVSIAITKHQTKHYTIQDGFPFNEFNRIPHHQSADSQLFFGSMNGVTSFHSSELLASDSSETVVFRLTKRKVITPELQEWLANVESQLLKHIGDYSFTIDILASDMAISKRQLARRIKELVGMTPNQYIKTIRYTKARDLLENKTYSTVKAVAYSVGFKDVVYFSRQYQERFGKFPSGRY